jgi:ABC-type transporter Mla subunit MlaD
MLERRMRSPSRSVTPRLRRKLPLRSRMTLRSQPSAPLERRERLKEALRTSREAVSDLERQLDALLVSLRKTGAAATDDVDGLRRAANRANAAVSKLG